MGGGSINERFVIQFVDGCYNQTGSGENIGGFSSLALNPTTNAVNLSYYDFNNKDLKYAYKEDSSNIWYTMSIDGSEINNDVGKFTSLAVDNSGNRHISYFDESNNDLNYAFGPVEGTPGLGVDISWQLYKVDTSGSVGKFTSLALDNAGNRHISYFDDSNKKIKYAFGPAGQPGDDISWQLYSVDTQGILNTYSSLAVDNLGNRHISYFDDVNDDLKYAFGPAGEYGVGISWELYSVDGSGMDIGKFTSIAVDDSGNPHISYYDDTNNDLKYAFGTAGESGVGISWELYSVDKQEIVGGYTSIAINPITQRPSISYFKNLKIDLYEIRITTQLADTKWEIGILDACLNFVNFNGNSQLKFGSTDSNKHLSFYETDDFNKLGRLRYAFSPAGSGSYGDSCPIFFTETFDVSKEVVSVSSETINIDFSFNFAQATPQVPFDISSREVNFCQ